jgi:flagellar biosynthesis protein FlhA
MATAATAKAPTSARYNHLLVPAAIVGILAILIFPLPTAVLDVCIALNIVLSLIILFTSLYVEKPLRFSSFPAVLLVTTLFRLAMNVASTRLILLNGSTGMDAAGNVIQAFGQFVVGGNYIIGIVMFICINLVNLKVLTKGSSRIAEVAARFTLDAMPGKQMAVDSDLNIGLITDKEARARRKELAQEAEFYGAMDGAAKFVAGDAVAALFLVAINIVGGLLIGIIQAGMDWREAAQTYTILTIGEGLVAQLPSIIISAAAGLIVARAASGEDLGNELVGQLGQNAKPLFLTSGVSFAMAVLPGLPFIPFMLLAIGTGVLGFMKRKTAEEVRLKAEAEEKAKLPENAGPKPGSTEEVTTLLSVDTLELEVGYELVQVVEGGDLVERIRSIRRQFAIDYGFIVPPIHIRDNVRIKSNEYRFMLKNTVIGSGILKPHYMLAMDPGNVSNPVNGIPTKEPSFGLDALWISEADKERAQFAGYTVVDLSTVVTTHITELVRSHMHELLGRQEVQHLIDTMQKQAPKVVEELIPGVMSIGAVQQVLANWAPTVKSPEKLAEFVRRKFSRAITAKYTTPDGVLPLVNLTGGLEREMGEALQQTDEGSFLALEPGLAQMIINKLARSSEKFGEIGQTPVLLAPAHLRPAVFNFVDRFAPGYAVISHNEVAPNTKVQSLGVIGTDD